MRDRPRERGRRRRAAGRRGVVLRVAPELERHRDGVLAPAAARPRRSPRRRSSRRARGRRRPARPRGPRRGAQRAMERVGGQVGGVQLARATARPAPRRSRVVPTRAASNRCSPSTSVHGRRAGGGQRAAARRRRSPPATTRSPSTRHRHADQVAAERAAGMAVKAPGTQAPRPIGRGEMLFEAFAVHDRLSLRPAVPAQAVTPALVEAASRACARSRSRDVEAELRRAARASALRLDGVARALVATRRRSRTTSVQGLRARLPLRRRRRAACRAALVLAVDLRVRRAERGAARAFLPRDRRAATSASTRTLEALRRSALPAQVLRSVMPGRCCRGGRRRSPG